MGKVEIEIGDDGKFGTLPEPIQKFVDRAIDDAYRKGAQKTSENLQAEIDRLKTGAQGDPVVREKLKAAERELSELREAQAIRDRNWEAAKKEVEDRHAKVVAERDDAAKTANTEIARRDSRIRELVMNEIAVIASKHGARQESIDELQKILRDDIGLDDGFRPFVKDPKDPAKARLDKDGKAVSVEGFVSQYLTDHPHHKAAAGGRGGGANGGKTLSQGAGGKAGHSGLDAVRASRAEADERFANIAKNLTGTH